MIYAGLIVTATGLLLALIGGYLVNRYILAAAALLCGAAAVLGFLASIF